MIIIQIGIFILCTSGFVYCGFNKCTDIQFENSNFTLATTLNGKIQGQCETVDVIYSNLTKISAHIFSWKKVPFAEPPIDELRFVKPIPIKDWTDNKMCIESPNVCSQLNDEGILIGSEDCLYLNVYVRSDIYLNRNSSLNPVLVFIHGGDFTSGSSTGYDPSTIVALSGIIVITIQYRLNLFGFLRLERTSATGNQGLFDQNLALKWVHENVKFFGGDQTRITAAGSDSGANSVFNNYKNKFNYVIHNLITKFFNKRSVIT